MPTNASNAGRFDLIPVKANAVILQNDYVCVDADGYLVPASDTSGLIFVGQSEADADATGLSSGDISCPVTRKGVLGYGTITTANADQTWVGSLLFFLTASTGALAGGTSHTIVAGRVIAIESATLVIFDPNDRFALGTA